MNKIIGPAPSPHLGARPLRALPTGLPRPAAPCPVTGSGHPWLCALAGPVLKRGSDPPPRCRDPSILTTSISPRPFPAWTSILPALGTPAHQRSRPLGWALTESELPSTLDSRLRPPGSGRSLPGPAPEVVLIPPQGSGGKAGLPRGTGSAAGSAPRPGEGTGRGLARWLDLGGPGLTRHRVARRARNGPGRRLPPFLGGQEAASACFVLAPGLCQPSKPSRAPGPVPPT